jgi:hypothetical protein
MTSALTAASKIMIFGDFRYYLIVDRIGMTVELVPHLFGATNQRPIGARGLLAYWRNTAGAERRGVQGARHHLVARAGASGSPPPAVPPLFPRRSRHG